MTIAASVWQAVGLDPPEPEYRFHDVRKWRFDYAWPEHKIALEINGGTWRREGGAHQRMGAIRDMEKSNAAVILGWRILHVTPQDMQTGAAIELLRRAFGKAAED